MDATAATTIDARGLRCPLPVLRLAAAARGAAPGSRFDLIADDAAAATDVPAFVRERGWTALATEAAPHGATRYRITL
jgi:tRNA 2-thiouridine synthesizing protein A